MPPSQALRFPLFGRVKKGEHETQVTGNKAQDTMDGKDRKIERRGRVARFLLAVYLCAQIYIEKERERETSTNEASPGTYNAMLDETTTLRATNLRKCCNNSE